ncbi:MAG TPA: oxidative damage protection protein [Longimicrobiales bacterium]
MAEIQCVHCGHTEPQLDRPPLRTELGQRIYEQICQRCWDKWLRYQTALINHYGLDVREREAREFLTANMEAFLFRHGEHEEGEASEQA